MKILNYKNKFRLILDVLFNSSKVNNKILDKTFSSVETIKQNYKDKLRLIQYEQYKNGVVGSDKNRIPIITIPIVDRTMQIVDDRPISVSASITHKEVETMRLSFMNPTLSGDALRNSAAFELAKELVAKGFLHTTVDEHTITFHLQIFE